MPTLKVRAFGVPIEIRASFFLVFAILGLPGRTGLAPILAFVAIATAAVLVHEAGHALVFRAFGDRPTIVLHESGGETRGSHQGVTRMLLVTAAGPVAGLLLGLVVLLIAQVAPAGPDAQRIIDDSLLLTVGLSLINLVPMGNFDGNALLNGLVSAATGRPAGVAGWVLGVLVVIGIVLVALAVGRYEVAFFVGFLVVISASGSASVVRLFGPPTGSGSVDGLLNLGRAEEALVLADKAVTSRPSDVEARRGRAAALLMLTRYEEALADFDALRALAPDDMRGLVGRFRALRALGDATAARIDLDRLLAQPATNVDDMAAQVVGLYFDHQYDRALDLLGAYLAGGGLARPEALALHGFVAVMESVNGSADRALRRVESLIAERPDDPPLHEIAALALIQLGRFDEAIDRARRALAGAPRHPELTETLAIAERLAGRPEVAVGRFVESAVARPDHARGRAELSICFTQLGRHAEAAAALDQLPAWTTAEPHVRYARACQLAATGRLDRAGAAVMEAAAIRPALGLIARVDPVLAPLRSDPGWAAIAAGLPAATGGSEAAQASPAIAGSPTA
jgi:tetratricopeptide (TPR) repeat protein